jgi:uncharacterized membrane protein YfcA
MIEILAIIYLCRKIGDLAEQKGLRRGLWQFYTVLAWIVGEIIGILLGIIIFQTNPDQLIPLVIPGYALAVASYFVLKAVLSKKPDRVDMNFEFEQQSEETHS